MADDSLLNNDALQPKVFLPPVPGVDTSLDSVMEASWRQNNTIISNLSSRSNRESLFPTDNTIIDDSEINRAISDNGLAPYVERFTDVHTRGALNAKVKDIQTELADRATLAASGWDGFAAGIITGIPDLPTLFPAGKLLGLGKAVAPSILRTVGETALAGAIDGAITEAGLHLSQQTRTLEDSAYNIGGSAVLAGLLGGAGAAAVNMSRFRKVATKIEADINSPPPKETPNGLALLIGKGADDTGPVFDAPEWAPPEGSPPPGHTRVYHGGATDPGSLADHVGELWVTRDPRYARDFRRGDKPNTVWSIDLPNDHPALVGAAGDLPNGIAPLSSFKIDEATARRAVLHGVPDEAPPPSGGTPPSPPAIPPTGRNLGGPGDGRGGPPDVGGPGDPPPAPPPSGGFVITEPRNLTGGDRVFAPSGGNTTLTRVAQKVGGGNPVLEMAAATMSTPKNILRALAELPGRTVRSTNIVTQADGVRTVEATPISVQSMMAVYQGIRERATGTFYRTYRGWLRDTLRGQGLGYYAAAAQNLITGRGYESFGRNVATAMLSGDARGSAHVQEAAAELTRSFNTLYDHAVDAGLARRIDNPLSEENARHWTTIEHWMQLEDQRNRLGVRDDLVLPEGHGPVTKANHETVPSVGTVNLRSGWWDRWMNRDITNRTNGYFPRQYLPDRIIQDRTNFVGLEAVAWLQERDRHVREGIGSDLVGSDRRLLRDIGRAGQASLLRRALQHADGAYWTISFGRHSLEAGSNAGTLKAGRRGAVLHRNVYLSDLMMLQRGWIESDGLEMLTYATRTLGADIQLAHRFRRPMSDHEVSLADTNHPDAYWLDGRDPTTVPDLSLTQAKAEMEAEYRAAITAIPDGDFGRNRLAKELDSQLTNVDTMVDMLRGTYGADKYGPRTRAISAGIKNFQFITKMGGVVLSSVPDAAQLILEHGVMGTLVRQNVAHLQTLIQNPSLRNALRDQGARNRARAAGAAVESVLMSRIVSNADLFDPTMSARSQGAFLNVLRGSAQMMGRLNFINLWTDIMRGAAFSAFNDRVVRAALDPGSVGAAEARWLATTGLTSNDLRAIAEQVRRQPSHNHNGMLFADAELWDDMDLRHRFYGAGMKSTNNANVNPSSLEKPRGFSDPVASVIFQFASFATGAQMRVFGQSMQRIIAERGMGPDSARVVLGLSSMIAAGMLVPVLHFAATGEWDKLDEKMQDPTWLPYQAMDRSGVLGAISQVNTTAENLGLPGIQAAMKLAAGVPSDQKPFSTYQFAGQVRNVFGPTAGTVTDFTHIVGDAYGMLPSVDQQPDKATAKRIQRNLPFGNLFYLSRITKEASQYVATDWLGARPNDSQ